MRPVCIIILFLALAGSARSVTLTEKDALFWALETNEDIQVSRISLKSDSLSAEQVRAGWLPQVALDASGDYTPVSTYGSGGTDGDNQASIGADIDLSVTQILPGGAVVSGNVSQGLVQDLDSSSSLFSTAYGVSVTQPLLQGAWTHARQDYTIKIDLLTTQEFSLRQKKQMITTLSGIRTRYWNYFEKSRMVKIARDRLDYSQDRLEAEKARLAQGQTAPLNTMSAALELLRARQGLLSAQSQEQNARRILARALLLGEEAVDLAQETEFEIPDLPDEDRFVAMVREYDPDLKIFALVRNRLLITRNKKRNDMLPEVDITGSFSRSTEGSEIFNDNGSSSSNAVISLLLSYDLPTKSRRIDLEKTELEQEENKLREKNHELEIRRRIRELLESWKLEKSRLEIMSAARTIAEKQLVAARQGYELGSVDRLELLKAENDFTQTRLDYLGAQITLKRLEVIFDEITGEILNKFGVTI